MPDDHLCAEKQSGLRDFAGVGGQEVDPTSLWVEREHNKA